MTRGAVPLIGWLLATAAPAMAQAPSRPTLTLGDVVARALVQNLDVVQAADAVQSRELGVQLASSAFRPNILTTASGPIGRSQLANQSYGVAVSQRLPVGTELRANATSTSSRNQIGPYFFTDTTLLVSQPLLRGFGREYARRTLDSAESALRDARRQREVRRQQVALETAGAYLSMVGRQAYLRVAERTVERAVALKDESVAKLAAGRVSQLDVLRAEQLVAQARAQQVDTVAALEDARDQLRLLMNAAADFAFEVESSTPASPPVPAEDAAVELALANRLDLESARESVEQADRSLRLARRNRWPQFDLQFGLTRQDVTDTRLGSFGLDGFQATTMMAVSMPVFNDAQDIEYRTAVIDHGQRVRELDAERRRVTVEVRRALREQRRAEQSAALARDSLELSRREVEVARLRFARGLSSNLDVVTAETSLLAAESQAIAADGQVTLSRLAVLAATGTLDPDTAFP
jgi:outer membrane protein TolC